jgi:steroid 5-alpha reductase family enzyme
MNKAELEAWIALPIIFSLGGLLAWAGSDGGQTYAHFPVYAWCVALAFGIQILAFVPAFLKQSEKFYDLTGSLTYLSVLATALVLTADFAPVSVLLSSLIAIWALRLGSFLFMRIQAVGEDSRFNEIKPSFVRFLMTWTLQGLWVSFSLAAALAAITSVHKSLPGIWEGVGTLVWLLGFGIEALADKQKNDFRKNQENAGTFIQSGLWAWSRHPNYFGEIVLWCGIALIAIPHLQGWQWFSLISPVFITLLLTRISGVPMLEAKSDQRWGGQADYEAYKAHTSVLILRPPKK